MELSQALELADITFRFAVVPLVAVLWKIHGRLSTIEGKVAVISRSPRR